MKILMVCLGNICRSPLAEGILKHKVGSRDILVDSAGTSSYHAGENPDERSIRVAHKYHIDISDQRSRPFERDDFDIFDLIFVMDSSNYQNVIKLTDKEEHKNKVQLILNMVDPGSNEAVPDPYYDVENGFQLVYNMLDEACNVIISKYDEHEL